MLMEISIRDDKAELFLQLIEELRHTVVERSQVVSQKHDEGDFAWNESELLHRIDDMHQEAS